MKKIEPTLNEWKALYESAGEFKKIEPWEWMSDSNIFGVQNPRTGEIGHCCVMGAGGGFFALAVYLGTEGLLGYTKMHSGKVKAGDPNAMFIQNCLMASFEDREYVEKEDKQVITSVGLKFKGPNEWPIFRNYKPGYYPWFINGEDARFLTIALQQAKDVCVRFEQDESLLVPPKGKRNLHFVRAFERAGDSISWKDEWRKPDPIREKELPAAEVDELRIMKIKKNIKPVSMVWEVDFFYSPTPVAEGSERPYFPYAIMIADTASGYIFGLELANPDSHDKAFAGRLLAVIEEASLLPAEIRVKKDETAKFVEPYASRLGILLRKVKKLSAVDNARKGMMRHFMGA